MNEIEQIDLHKYEDKEPIFVGKKDSYLGKVNLKVRLSSDMDDGFLERLKRILASENSNSKNTKT
jgi:hypothetical protein